MYLRKGRQIVPLGGDRNVDRRHRGNQSHRHHSGLLIDAENHRGGEAERQRQEPQNDVAAPHTPLVSHRYLPLSHTALNSSIAAAFVLRIHLQFSWTQKFPFASFFLFWRGQNEERIDERGARRCERLRAAAAFIEREMYNVNQDYFCFD